VRKRFLAARSASTDPQLQTRRKIDMKSYILPRMVLGLVMSLFFPTAEATAQGQAQQHVQEAAQEVVSAAWAKSWQEDLRFLSQELREKHPAPFHALPEATFDAELEELVEAVPSLSHQEIVVRLAMLMARIKDGHTRLTLPLPDSAGFFRGHAKTPQPKVPDLLFHPLPIRLYLLPDGLYVWRVDASHALVAGARVLGIGSMTSEEAQAAVAPVVHSDNEPQLRLQLPDYLVIPEILQARGVVEGSGSVEFRLELADGSLSSLSLSSKTAPVTKWATAFPQEELPLYLRHRERHFWFEYLEDQRALYLQYNTCYDEANETIAAFAQRLLHFVEDRPVEKLILDLRWNRGGDNSNNRSLIHALIRSPKLQQPGSLFTITGRGTFSAAMMLAVDLERHTNSLFVGEPTGSSPNHYGDSRRVTLPQTGVTVRISTLYWQYSDPRDRRQAISPHLPAPLTPRALRSGRDPALETILSGGSRGSVEGPIEGANAFRGRWAGQGAIFRDDLDFIVDLERSSDSWTAALTIPQEEVANLPLENVSIEGATLRFSLPTPGGALPFVGRLEGGRIYGELGRGSTVGVVALQRAGGY